MKRKIEKWRLW